MRDSGYKLYDCHSPFPIHGMNKAMGVNRSNLGYLVGIFALIGFSGALLLQWWTSAIDYPIIISGKPFFSYQAFVPVIFALAVLFSALAVTFGMLIANRLPMLFHPLFSSARFKRFSTDGFFISVESNDPRFDSSRTKAFLESIGGKNIELLSEY